MPHHIPHVHVFAPDLDRRVGFYRDFLGGKVILDMELAGAREGGDHER